MSKQTEKTITKYYQSWKDGNVNEKQLREVLDPKVRFEGSIDTVDGADGLIQGIREFVGMNKGITFHAQVYQDKEGFCLYDAHTAPIGDLRLAEHFSIEGGKIKKIHLVYDSIKLRPMIEAARAGKA